MSRLNLAAVKKYARAVRNERNPNATPLRISNDFTARLDRHMCSLIERAVHVNGGRKTLNGEALNLILGKE